MVRNFDHLIELAIEKETGKIAVVAADHVNILEVVDEAIKMNLGEFILIGDENIIRNIIEEESFNIDSEILNAKDHNQAANMGVELIKSGDADLIMKGMIHSSTFLKSLLNKEANLLDGSVISQASLLEKEDEDGFILLTDCAIAVEPDLKTKKAILENAGSLSRILGVKTPKAGILSAVEVVNPMMPDTIDAAALSKMSERGQLGDLLVDGPLALDNIISKESALAKGIDSEVAGDVDIIMMPNLLVGNSVSKAITGFAGIPMVSATLGLKIPVIFNSRTETIAGKILSIALAKYMS